MNTERIVRQHLEDLQRAGLTSVPVAIADFVDELIQRREAAAAVTSSTSQTAPRIGIKRPIQSQSPTRPETRPPNVARAGTTSADAQHSVADPNSDLASAPVKSQSSPANVGSKDGHANVEQLALVAQQVAACQKCQELANTRRQTVFGVGNPNAEIMFIGEAPGADEDRQGEPFVGKAGQLLNKIITACGLAREDIYICNILRCRPPGNRNPTPIEADNCREFLDAQIEIVKPSYIVCWGSIAAQNLLNSKTSIGRMRGKFFDYRGIKVSCTYHPSYLLRNPSAKKLVWEDMKFFRADMGITL